MSCVVISSLENECFSPPEPPNNMIFVFCCLLMTQQDIFVFQYLMEDLTLLPHLLFLHLFVISNGHAFGASGFHILRMQHAKLQYHNPFFMETFIIAAWQIWKQRNNFIFDRGRPSFGSWKSSFCEEATLQAHRFSDEKCHVFLSCIAALD